ncbi:unnamed protein product [Adineta steineri]|uniref:Uncharacterized protein n=1 Tax=Adineta steineri TaxID=433720 RepID=A0A815B9D3_9BILA|nr:unnamed protein product [Adineta steineri]CAF4051973.1 unnamed protein product [Adineta steineri]
MESSENIDSFLSAPDNYEGSIQNLHFANGDRMLNTPIVPIDDPFDELSSYSDGIQETSDFPQQPSTSFDQEVLTTIASNNEQMEHSTSGAQAYDSNLTQHMDTNEQEITAVMIISLEAEQADRLKVEAITAAICQYGTPTKANDQ